MYAEVSNVDLENNEDTTAIIREKLNSFINFIKLVNKREKRVEKVGRNSSLDLIINGIVHYAEEWVEIIFDLYKNATIVIYDNNYLDEVKKINKTLSKYGAKITSDFRNTEVVFINLDSRNSTNNNLREIKNDDYIFGRIKSEVLDYIRLLTGCEDKEMPYIFMKKIYITNKLSFITDGHDEAVKLYGLPWKKTNEKLNLKNGKNKRKGKKALKSYVDTHYDLVVSYLVGTTAAEKLNEIIPNDLFVDNDENKKESRKKKKKKSQL